MRRLTSQIAPMTRPLRVAQRSLGAPLLSTLLTGTTNLALPVLVQLASGTAATGALTLSLTPLTISLAVQRGVLSQTYLRGIARAPRIRTAIVAMATLALVGSAALMVLLRLDPIFWLAVAVTPIALFQDAFRFRAMGVGRAALAATSDGMWLAALALGTVVALLSETGLSVTNALWTYAAGALVAALFGLFRWPRVQGPQTPYASVSSLVTEGLLIAGLGTLAQPVLVLAAGLDALGILRIAQITAAIPALMISTFQSALLRITKLEDVASVRHAARTVVLPIAITSVVISTFLVLMPRASLVAAGIEARNEFLSTVIIVHVSTVLGAWVMVLMWRVRISARVRSWVGMRALGSVTELAVASTLGWFWGPQGVAAGPVANSVIVGSYATTHMRSEERLQAAS